MTDSIRTPSDAMPEVAVVVPTYCRPDGVRRLFGALASQTLPRDRWELVLVDDGSEGPTAAAIDALAIEAFFQVRVLHNAGNQGAAAARNRGWKSTSAPIIAFTDDDCEPDPGWLEAGISAFQSQLELGIAQGRTIRPRGSEGYPYSCFTVIREVKSPTPWFEGCNLFLRRQALEDGGGFDESLGFFGEETSLGWAVLNAGWKRGWVDDAVVVHELTERPWRWHLRIHYLERNIVALAARYPQMRLTFWRRWAVKRENALFAAALAGLLISPRRRWGILLTLPYVNWLFPRGQPSIGWKAALHQISVHGASLLGKVPADLRHRVLIL